MTPHDTPRTDERAGLSEVGWNELDRVLVFLWSTTGRVASSSRQAQIDYGKRNARTAVERIIADRLAAAVARAESAEAKVAAAWRYVDKWEADELNTAVDKQAAADCLRAALADVPTSAPTGEGS